MELRHLRYFIAVAEELHFSRAAERLQMAQPPLSQQVQALEAELGVKLFDRKKRPLQLTVAGQAFLEEVRLTLAQLNQAVYTAQRIHQGELGFLTVGFTSSIANGVLPDILRTFREHYPEVKLTIREDNHAAQLQRLRDRQTDIIFVYQHQALTEASNLSVMPLVQEPLVVVLPKTHSLATYSKISITNLAEEEFVMPLHQVVSGLSDQIYQLCSSAGFVPRVSQEAIFMITILGLIAGGNGISILPSSVHNLHREGVVYRQIQEPTMMQLVGVWQPNHLSFPLQQFLNIAKNMSTCSLA